MGDEFAIRVLTVRVLAPRSMTDAEGEVLSRQMDDLGENLHGAALAYVASVTTPEQPCRVEVNE
jgi:hypothetical protein